ncbi:unnamed protein product [Protopolystoma xenopodis]|uniref:Uncharacterized protein n=1 Tax=Protopolystoma xenopodis TaxID=117903 RepID=A0A3S5FD26_9PLAT|nr:unnamed protein product [Protopolystoma xenopodis]
MFLPGQPTVHLSSVCFWCYCSRGGSILDLRVLSTHRPKRLGRCPSTVLSTAQMLRHACPHRQTHTHTHTSRPSHTRRSAVKVHMHRVERTYSPVEWRSPLRLGIEPNFFGCYRPTEHQLLPRLALPLPTGWQDSKGKWLSRIVCPVLRCWTGRTSSPPISAEKENGVGAASRAEAGRMFNRA